jgi:hypothetical protein
MCDMQFGDKWFLTSTVEPVKVVRERVPDLGSPLRFMLRRSSLVECVSVLHGTCLQCAEKKYIHQYVKKILGTHF